MGKSTQRDKNSFLGSRLGRFAQRLMKRPQKSNKAISPVVESEPSVMQPVVGVQPVYQEQKKEECDGLDEDRLSCVPEEHVEPEKQKKAIRHIEKLLEQIAQCQNEIDTGLQTEICLEQEIFDLLTTNEQSSHQTLQRKRVKEHRKQQADELSVTKQPVRKCQKRSLENTRKNGGHQANINKVRKKLCLRCKKKKSESDFHKDRSCKDSLARWCKECKAKATKKYHKKQTVR